MEEKLNDLSNEIIESGLSADSLIVYKYGMGYLVNKKEEDIINLRSIAKTVLSLACGILIDKNPDKFNLDTRIYPLIESKIQVSNKKNLKYLKEIKVRDLLTHTTGFRDLLLFSKDLRDKNLDELLNYTINYPIYYKPGSFFLYSNASYYLLSATMEEYLGTDLLQFICDNLFDPLDIPNRKWDKYGNYLVGASKLYGSADDLLKFAKLILNDGKYSGKQIISAEYIRTMQRPFEKNRNEDKRKYLSHDSYGLGLWISDSNIVFASGTGGQLIVILNDLQTVIITTNADSDSKSYRINLDVERLIEIIKN